MLREVMSNINLLVNNTLNYSDVTNIIKKSVFKSELTTTFEHFSSLHNFKKYTEGHYNYVIPRVYNFGLNSNLNSVQYVPILSTLKALLSHDDIFQEVIQGHFSNERNIMDFCDGQNFIKNPLFQDTKSHSLMLQLYCDDVCLGNALSTCVKQMKICAIYFSLQNISPSFRSKLYTIQLAMLFNPVLQKTHLSEVLQPLINDLMVLENDGITICKEDKILNFKGTLTMICADNLAAHQLGGFNKFNAHRHCRRCLISKEQRKVSTHENACTLRTAEAYNRQVKDPNAKMYGLLFDSPFNQLKYFHVTNGLPFDLDHDLFEGIIAVVLEEFLKYSIERDFFSLEYLNETILSFPYADVDIGNKPSPMGNDIRNLNIRQTASQCWCLLRLLPLFIGHKLPYNDKKWQVMLLLMDIVENVTTRQVSEANMILLGYIIEDFYCLYMEEFDNGRFTPKFHHLLHYPRQMLEYGPAVTCRTNRYESKHQSLKEYMNRTKNRKNIPLTLAQRHESYQVACRTENDFLRSSLQHFGGQLVPVESLPSLYSEKIEQFVQSKNIYIVTRVVTSDGLKYSVGSALITRTYIEEMNFSLIDSIIFYDNEIYLVLHNLETVNYIRHMNSYDARGTNSFEIVNIKHLVNKFQVSTYSHSSGILIVLKDKPVENPTLDIPPLGPKEKLNMVGRILFSYGETSASVNIENEISLEHLKILATETLDLHFPIELFIFDEEFKEFVKLLDIASVKHLQRIKIKKKVVEAPLQGLIDQQQQLASCLNSSPSNGSCNGNILTKNFEVPNFSGKVLLKLLSGEQLNRSDRTSILDKIYDSIKPFTVYPMSADYRHVTSKFLQKFPMLSFHVGEYLAWAQWNASIKYKFQNIRKSDCTVSNLPQVQARSCKRRNLGQCIEVGTLNNSSKKKNMWGLINYLPPRLEGDSDEIVKEHLAVLEVESRKGRPDVQKIYSSMNATLADRRKEIVELGASVEEITKKYHFLTNEEDIFMEYARISGKEEDRKVDEFLTKELNKLAEPLVKITRKFDLKDQLIKTIVDKYNAQRTDTELEKYQIPCSVLLIIHLLKENYRNIFVKEGSATLENVTIFVSYNGDLEEMPANVKVHIDRHTVECTSLAKAIAVYLAIHFIFNARYTKFNTKFLSFVEKYCAKIKSDLPTAKPVLMLQKKIIEAQVYGNANST